MIGHTGSVQGGGAIWFYFPAYHTVIFAAVNRNDLNMTADPGPLDGVAVAQDAFIKAWNVVKPKS